MTPNAGSATKKSALGPPGGGLPRVRPNNSSSMQQHNENETNETPLSQLSKKANNVYKILPPYEVAK